MKKIVIFIYILGMIFICKLANATSKLIPNWLLTPDYGILNQDDLNTANLNRIHKIPMHTSDENDYSYWQCFPAKNVSLKCRSWPADEVNHNMSDADIRVNYEGKYHNYGFRHAVELEACLEYLKTWNKLVKTEKAICLLGISTGIEQEKINNQFTPVHGWVWERLKTKKGCYSFFAGECDAAHWKKTNNYNK